MKVKAIDTSLRKKGFECNDKSDHVRYILYVDGMKTMIMTKVSHGDVEIGDGLITAMSRQLKLSKNQFMNLINCTLSKEEYAQTLQNNGVVISKKK